MNACHVLSLATHCSVFVACQVELFLRLVAVVTGKELRMSYGVVCFHPSAVHFPFLLVLVVTFDLELWLLSPK